MMPKETICEIRRKMGSVPDGTCLSIRHPLREEKAVRETSETDLPAGARLKTEIYEVYPGIELSYNYFLGDKFPFHHCHGRSVMSVDHCRRGRIGWEMEGGLSLYFGSGDLSFHATDKCARSYITLPLGYYEGLTVSLDLDVLREHSPEILQDAGIDAGEVCRRFCGHGETSALPASSRIEHIFSEVYELPEKMKLPYLKLKCQELILFLNMTESSPASHLDPYHSRQVEIIRSIHDRITEDLTRRYTIDELSREYLINTAALKSIFKSVYGMPVASYMKQYRIMQAAAMLRNSGESVSSIAAKVGYESQSKFSAAFKDVMKILPTDYRRQYS